MQQRGTGTVSFALVGRRRAAGGESSAAGERRLVWVVWVAVVRGAAMRVRRASPHNHMTRLGTRLQLQLAIRNTRHLVTLQLQLPSSCAPLWLPRGSAQGPAPSPPPPP
jgi:hypothetical protein